MQTTSWNDISDEDTDSDVEAKVSNCINSGSVYADINAGGITGAMARENDLDPEDDYTIAGSESLNFTFKTRVVARDCTNYGTVSAKSSAPAALSAMPRWVLSSTAAASARWTPRTPPAWAAWPV